MVAAGAAVGSVFPHYTDTSPWIGGGGWEEEEEVECFQLLFPGILHERKKLRGSSEMPVML